MNIFDQINTTIKMTQMHHYKAVGLKRKNLIKTITKVMNLIW